MILKDLMKEGIEFVRYQGFLGEQSYFLCFRFFSPS